MTEKKKVAARKPTPRKAKAKKPETENPKAKKMHQTRPDDEAMKQAVLAAALPQAAFDGFTDAVLEKAGAEADVSKADMARLFEGGPLSLVEYYSTWADAQMEAALAAMDLKTMKIRERIAAAVMARLHALKPHKEAARRAAAFLSLPMHAALGAKLAWRTVDAMWRAAGDTSTDFNFYTKRGILAGVYGSTAMRWFNDDSADEAPTREFLAARIENVMQFEKFKAKAKDALSAFPMFADWAKKKTP
jgi:ubiquinone biosynthesis protein COQ9